MAKLCRAGFTLCNSRDLSQHKKKTCHVSLPVFLKCNIFGNNDKRRPGRRRPCCNFKLKESCKRSAVAAMRIGQRHASSTPQHRVRSSAPHSQARASGSAGTSGVVSGSASAGSSGSGLTAAVTRTLVASQLQCDGSDLIDFSSSSRFASNDLIDLVDLRTSGGDLIDFVGDTPAQHARQLSRESHRTRAPVTCNVAACTRCSGAHPHQFQHL